MLSHFVRLASDRLEEVNEGKAGATLRSVEVRWARTVSDDEEEINIKFLKYSPDKQKPPINIFMSGVGENMPIKDYETFKTEKN